MTWENLHQDILETFTESRGLAQEEEIFGPLFGFRTDRLPKYAWLPKEPKPQKAPKPVAPRPTPLVMCRRPKAPKPPRLPKYVHPTIHLAREIERRRAYLEFCNAQRDSLLSG